MTHTAAAYDMLGGRPLEDLRQLAQRIHATTAQPTTPAHELRAHLHARRPAAADGATAYERTADFLAELSSSRAKLAEQRGGAGGEVWRALAHEQMRGSSLLAAWVAESLALVAALGSRADALLAADTWAAGRLAAHRGATGAEYAPRDAEDALGAGEADNTRLLGVFVRGVRALDAMGSAAAWVAQGVAQGVSLFCTQEAAAAAAAKAGHPGTWDRPVLGPLVQRAQRAGATLDALLQTTAWVSSACMRGAQLALLEVRQLELFSLVVEYPASARALDDLRMCCAGQPGMLRATADRLQRDVCARLLHAGAATGDIVGFYAAAVGALGRVDRTGLVLWAVAGPIRRYLQGRSDAVACIVGELLDGALADGGPEGAAELSSAALLVEGEEEPEGTWHPRPRDAQGAGTAAADVAVQLLGVFDTDAYVRAFDGMLAGRLLRLAAYDASAEVRQVERMGGYLGARAVERSRVMLRDIAESRRLDGQISGATGLHATVVSRQFWPTAIATTTAAGAASAAAAAAREPSWTLPPEMERLAAQWAGAYEALRPARRLEWRHALGSVALEVEMLDGRTVRMRVRPIDAAVLVAIEEMGRVDARSIAEALECTDVPWVRTRLRAWVARGVLREPAVGVFEPADHRAAADDGGGALAETAAAAGEEEVHGEMEELEEHEPEVDAGVPDLSVHYNYIVGMLTNIGPLPLDRMHAMLAMFVPGDATTAEQLRAFLAVKLRDDDERLEMSGGMYRLRG
ncbi:hypothetical protein LPJ53_004149 [Coemansia erecta]|uniref:Anaphase-promoting complex subunit 2 n=1 Tax=Coemansia erecta TaxID=147472 RepID=A0A9W7XYF4_9FUNG|nr:hypothetical protein LPJ53_004149 [Coemansia erecta]